ncbi:MAG TPA: hypothetical protein PLP07_14740 [Pyrinomonadaceae bacterium]|nr:hypothetical protein [Chloracidobacterium sp.]MBP9936838.1 hypothetical protein [Pyrinomonadaceae bacterium]MBK7804086.1 hypothetical protein [Chloracidobacterium sp.]MBK9439243.1 hypothetical protein [Chloracidobacterium sp.]MBK9767056.1 hypothetical protein [Chloracidobacterium sp.]
MPNKIIWAWERPEDLRAFEAKEFAVAFLAQTIFLKNNDVTPKLRRQPLEVAPGAYLIAVTRIETDKDGANRPTFDKDMIERIASLVRGTLDLPNVRAIQIDFDAVVSERQGYRKLMLELRRVLSEPRASGDGTKTSQEYIPLTMTSLASWCTGDAWFNDFPVDEAVPMVFQMGADSDKIKTYLRNGNDWMEPLCRGSYGISLDEGKIEGMKDGRRMYYFKNTPWNATDLTVLNTQ